MNICLRRFYRQHFVKKILSPEINYALSVKVSSYSRSQDDYSYEKLLKYAVSGSLAIGLSAFLLFDGDHVQAAELEKYGKVVKGLPTFNMQDVSKHSTPEKGIWVTYREGVYDITKFIKNHPGGDKILMAAGGSLEPFWALYSVHKRNEVLDMLESFRIGNLDDEDVLVESSANDPYGKEPRRHPALKPASVKPFNAEPPPALLTESFLTPQELFYVRNHLPVPDISEESYELEIGGLGLRTKTLKMKDIKKLPRVTVTATVQCAGNRRSEMTNVKDVKGLKWGPAALGNAEWTGVRLCDLLKQMGLKEGTDAQHVQFEGMDLDPASVPYGASIPIEKALDPKGGVILAYEMNGEPLNRDHGYPLRVIVPGVTGARNVKWLGKIVVSKEESDSHWQQNDYKGFSPSVDWDTVDFSKSPAIQELPVTSAICNITNGDTVVAKDGKLTVSGYAWSGGGRKIVRVDLTTDGGKSWQTAELVNQHSDKHPHHWAWTLWQVELVLPPKQKCVEIWAKAVDSSYNTQPESFENIWNLRGVLSNAYHRVTVNVKK